MAKFNDGGAGEYIPPFPRTDRPYIFDLCAHYNRTMSQSAGMRGLEWYVSPAGELKLGETQEWQRERSEQLTRMAESERNRMKARTWATGD